MGKLALVFSGQGAQYPGMGRALYEGDPLAKELFDQAEALRPGTLDQCFEGPKALLAQTENTQPCVFCVDLAAAAALEGAGFQIDGLAGFSLGELAALTFAQAMDFPLAFDLVCRRAQAMQAAGLAEPATMVAVLKLEASRVEEICRGFSKTYPVNYNSPGQTVVALAQDQCEAFAAQVKAQGGRVLPLPVSGGFHSPFMAPAAQTLEGVLQKMALKQPVLPVYANISGSLYPQDLAETLLAQVQSPVRWQQTIETMIQAGFDTFIEVGPGKTLCGLIQKIAPEVRVFNVEDMESLNKTLESVQ